MKIAKTILLGIAPVAALLGFKWLIGEPMIDGLSLLAIAGGVVIIWLGLLEHQDEKRIKKVIEARRRSLEHKNYQLKFMAAYKEAEKGFKLWEK